MQSKKSAKEKAASHAWGGWRHADGWAYRNCTRVNCGAMQKTKAGGGVLWNVGGAKACVGD
jgi:hypothetical protein